MTVRLCGSPVSEAGGAAHIVLVLDVPVTMPATVASLQKGGDAIATGKP